MDKYEFKLSLDEINHLIQERRFEEAANIADTIDWNHVRSTKTLGTVSEVYKIVGEYERSRDVMEIAYQREPENPSVVYSLCELSFHLYGTGSLQNDYARGLQMLQEYQALEPSNPKRLILQYRMYDVSHVSDDEKIAVLEQLKKEKPSARWEYELAKLYASSGDGIRAAAMCTDIMEIFGGKYGAEAERLLQRLRLDQETQAGASAVDVDAVKAVLDEDTSKAQVPSARKEAERKAAREPERTQTGAGSESGETGRTDAAVFPQETAPEEASFDADEFSGRQTGPEQARPEFADAYQNREIRDAVPGTGTTAMQQTPVYQRSAFAEEASAVGFELETTGVPSGRSDGWGSTAPAQAQPQAAADESAQAAGSQSSPGQVTETETSISEVMAEWERIRADIRRANDEKRAQRIMQDTGSILQSFDETARHGLLEDIEKGVARQRRKVRSERYGSQNAGVRREDIPEDEVRRNRRAERYEEDRHPEEEPAYADAGQYETPEYGEQGRYDESAAEDAGRYVPSSDEEQGWYDRPVDENAVQSGAPEEEDPNRNAGIPGDPVSGKIIAPAKDADEEPAPQPAGIPVRNDDDDTRVYRPEASDAATRRWNAEEVHRSVLRSRQEVSQTPRERVRREEEPVPSYVPGHASAAVQPGEQALEDAFYDELEDTPQETPAPEQDRGEPVAEEYEEFSSAALAGSEEESAALEADEEYEEKPAEPEDSGDAGTAEEFSGRENAPGEDESETSGDAETPERTAASEGGDTAEAAPADAASAKGKRELTREERRLFGPFCRMKENVDQLTEALEQISLSSTTGNLLILGNEATADRVAKGILDIIRRSDSNFTGRIAKATGESLNRLDAKGFSKTFGKLEGGALIVTRAGDIAPKTLERLYQEIEGRERGLILILTDGNKKLEQFRRDNEKYLGSFTAIISIKPLDDKALVSYAKDYALSQDYSIDEFGQLALAQRISSMQTQSHHVTLKEVRDLVDEAIAYASRKNLHTLIEIVTRKRYDEDDRIILHEKDFTHY